MDLRIWIGAIVALLFGVVASLGAPFQAPEEEPILVISGNIQSTNVGKTAQFDRPMLEALGLVTIETHTPWYQDLVVFEGVRFSDLMAAVGAKGDRVTAKALNDYVTTLPLKDDAGHDPIIALKRDGRYMTVRDKGPLCIIYPFDSDADLQTQTYYARSAWQLFRLVVE